MLNQEVLKGPVEDAHRGTGDLSRELSSSGGFLFQFDRLFHFVVGFLQKSEIFNVLCKRNQRKKFLGPDYFQWKSFCSAVETGDTVQLEGTCLMGSNREKGRR